MSQFLGHEVIDGKCHPVMLHTDASGVAKARSAEPGAKVEWHEVTEGAWHREGECGKPTIAPAHLASEPVGSEPLPISHSVRTWPDTLDTEGEDETEAAPVVMAEEMPEEPAAPPEPKRGRGRPKKR